MFKPLQNGIFVFVISIIYSLIEIEMEGEYGWCEKLPTAKKVISSFTFLSSINDGTYHNIILSTIS